MEGREKDKADGGVNRADQSKRVRCDMKLR